MKVIKISEERVRELYQKGESMRAIAKKMNVAHGTISRILKKLGVAIRPAARPAKAQQVKPKRKGRPKRPKLPAVQMIRDACMIIENKPRIRSCLDEIRGSIDDLRTSIDKLSNLLK